MFYKLSNTATRKTIEKEFNVAFEFSQLYKPSSVINGLEESTLPIITADDTTKVQFGIWGLLPQELEDNWKVYQNFTNTLNINIEQLDVENSLYENALDERRCIVIITGFFTSKINDGKMYPYHVHLKDHKPFAVAGIYNQLEDGFLTFSILINKTTNNRVDIPSILSYKPVIFDANDQGHWLNTSLEYNNLKDLIASHKSLEYTSDRFSKEFYDNDIVFKNMLDSDFF